MRLLADESCDFTVVVGVRVAGHDVVSIAERMPGVEDEKVIELAASERRLLLTEDKDFGQLVLLPPRTTRVSSSSAILHRLDRPSPMLS